MAKHGSSLCSITFALWASTQPWFVTKWKKYQFQLRIGNWETFGSVIIINQSTIGLSIRIVGLRHSVAFHSYFKRFPRCSPALRCWFSIERSFSTHRCLSSTIHFCMITNLILVGESVDPTWYKISFFIVFISKPFFHRI